MPRKKKDNSEMLPVITHKPREQHFEEITTFIPVRQIGTPPPKFTLSKGEYNRDYVIALLKSLLNQIHAMRFSPQHLQLTLQHSIQKLLADIEMESYRESGIKHEPECKSRY